MIDSVVGVTFLIFHKNRFRNIGKNFDQKSADVPILLMPLKYSEMNLSRIAEVMQFPTLSLFSRFIKKQSGFSPKEYRKILQNDIT